MESRHRGSNVVEIIKMPALSICFTALFASIGVTANAGCSEEPRRAAAQLAAYGDMALVREPSSPPGAKGEKTAGTLAAEDFSDNPDQGLGWQWPEERTPKREEPSADATASPARQTGPATDDPKESEDFWDDPDQGRGWQWPATDMPTTPQ